ncbi:hypothetical protein L2E82_06434 [Cichorium intybus]|uniref:Uncharacterized protein n=1 Tax=Cichorium intybus TaxID=13427 RepID=A0ACB9HC88_CICIN|nr:hypothetical protein L2E82_06434 [Cichorium intybus]
MNKNTKFNSELNQSGELAGICGDASDLDTEGSFQYRNYYREVDDLQAVMQYVMDQNHSLAAIIGHIKGGNVVLLYASGYSYVQKEVNISGWFDFKKRQMGTLKNKKFGLILKAINKYTKAKQNYGEFARFVIY